MSCEDDHNAAGQPLACDVCERPFIPAETLCPVCDAPNPWARRDSLHFWCRECGTTQTLFSGRSIGDFAEGRVPQTTA